MEALANAMVAIILQYINVSNQYTGHFIHLFIFTLDILN